MTPPAPDHAPTAPDQQEPAAIDVVVPVKPLAQAKSRLSVLGDDVRRDLALAFVRDVLAALRGAHGVRACVVVTADEQVAGLVRDQLGGWARVVPDAEPRELNRALHRGVAALRAAEVGAPDARVLALCADLPALTPHAVSDLLTAAPRAERSFVADRAGVGTTAYLAPPALFDPQFGPRSRAAHAARGAVDLTALARPELRADVDNPDDLAGLLSDARLGEATRAALVRHGLDRRALAGADLPRA